MAIESIFDQIGGFGRFQLLFVVWVYSMKFMVGWSTMLLSFANFKNDYACVDERVFNQSALELLAEPEVLVLAERGYNNTSLLDVCEVDGVRCQQFFFFGSKRTITAEFSLVCDHRWLKNAITSIQFTGVLVGAVIGGQSGDYFGRKKTLYGSYFFHTIFNVIGAFSVNWQMFAALRFCIGIMVEVVLVMIVPYSTEFYPIKWRHVIPPIPMWPLGVCAFAGGAWLLEDWANLHLACAVLAIPGLLGYFYIPESPRWLATQGREREAYTALDTMARLNGKDMPSSARDTIKTIALEEKETGKGSDYSYFDLFQNRDSIKITVIAGFQWFVLSIVFYGLSFAVTSFVGNIYLNIFLMSVVNIPSNLLAYLLIDRLGRRWTCLMFLGVAVLVSFVCAGIQLTAEQDGVGTAQSYICLVAQFAINACWTCSQSWVTESYPTVTRSLGYGFANMTSRVGAIIAPFAINLEELPLFTFTLMGVMGLVSMVMTYFWPETKNKTMAETVFERKSMTYHLAANNNLDPDSKVNHGDFRPLSTVDHDNPLDAITNGEHDENKLPFLNTSDTNGDLA